MDKARESLNQSEKNEEMEKSETKEDSDKAWWSDYQASTKLKRKWIKEEKNDLDDFDDILGDLDDIVKRSDEPVKRELEQKSTSDYCTQSISSDASSVIKGKNSK